MSAQLLLLVFRNTFKVHRYTSKEIWKDVVFLSKSFSRCLVVFLGGSSFLCGRFFFPLHWADRAGKRVWWRDGARLVPWKVVTDSLRKFLLIWEVQKEYSLLVPVPVPVPVPVLVLVSVPVPVPACLCPCLCPCLCLCPCVCVRVRVCVRACACAHACVPVPVPVSVPVPVPESVPVPVPVPVPVLVVCLSCMSRPFKPRKDT